MSERTPQNRSITRRSVARAPATFQIHEDPLPPPPITLSFPNIPNIRFELVSPIRDANPTNNATIQHVIQPTRWYTEPAGTGTWSLGLSRQMHQDYEVRSWHRVSPSISRSESLFTTDEGDDLTTDEGEARTTDGGEAQTISSMVAQIDEENAVQTNEETSMSQLADSQGSDQPGKKERNRDRIRRFGMSIVKRFSKFKSDKRDREDRRPHGSRLRRAFSDFGLSSAARRAGQ